MTQNLKKSSFIKTNYFGNWIRSENPTYKVTFCLIFTILLLVHVIYTFKIFDSLNQTKIICQSLTLSSFIGLGLPLFFFILKQKNRSSELIVFLGGLLISSLVMLTSTIDTWSNYYSPSLSLVSGIYFSLAYIFFYIEIVMRHKSTAEFADYFSSDLQSAHLVEKNQTKEVPISELNIGDIIEVSAGEIIPIDGEIVSGATSVDESILRSEKTILQKMPGSRVLANSINRDSPIQIKLVDPVEDHFLPSLKNQILDNLDQISLFEQKMIKVSWLVFFIGILFSGISIYLMENPKEALLESLCVIAFTSLTIWIRSGVVILYLGFSNLALKGIYLHSYKCFQKLANLNYLFCEKTGTLTRGKFYYSQFSLEPETNQGTFLSNIFSLESQCNHPLAESVKTHPWYIEIPQYQVEDFQAHQSLGICGKVHLPNQKPTFVVVGNARFLKRNQMYISKNMREKIEELESMGETVILCGWDRQAKGLMSFADTLRVDVNSFLEKVRLLKIKPIMITGDHAEMVGNLAYTKQLEEIYTRCLDQEKAKKIKNRQVKGKTVGMLGFQEGIGDGFDQADVGIVFGVSHLKNKMKNILILGKQLLKVTDLLLFSKQIYKIFRAHFRFGIFVTTLSFILNMFGILNPFYLFLVLFCLHLWLLVYPLSLTEIQFDADL